MRRSKCLHEAIRFAVSFMLLASACLTAMSTAAAAQQRTLCVHDVPAGEALKVRSAPGTRAAVIGEFPSGACGVRLTGKCNGDWCQMALAAKSGWVDTRHIGVYEIPPARTTSAPETASLASQARLPQPQASDAAKPPASRYGAANPSPAPPREIEQGSREPAPGACVARVEKWDTLRIRSGPGVGNEEIGAIPAGACRIERVGGCRGEWCRVVWRGRSGWVNTFYLD